MGIFNKFPYLVKLSARGQIDLSKYAYLNAFIKHGGVMKAVWRGAEKLAPRAGEASERFIKGIPGPRVLEGKELQAAQKNLLEMTQDAMENMGGWWQPTNPNYGIPLD